MGVLPRYLILVTLLIDGDDKLGDVCDELIALGLPQRLCTHLQMLNQNLLTQEEEGIRS